MLSLLFPWKKKLKTRPGAGSEPKHGPARGGTESARSASGRVVFTENRQPTLRTGSTPVTEPVTAPMPDDPDQEIRASFDPAIMRKGFENLSPNARKHVQRLLAQMGLHPATPDGSWHPDTDLGAARLARRITENSHDGLRFDLRSRGDVTRLFTGLRDGAFKGVLAQVARPAPPRQN